MLPAGCAGGAPPLLDAIAAWAASAPASSEACGRLMLQPQGGGLLHRQLRCTTALGLWRAARRRAAYKMSR